MFLLLFVQDYVSKIMPSEDAKQEAARRCLRRRDRFKRTGNEMKHVRADLIRDGE